MDNEFSVYQFFEDDSYEVIERFVKAEKAMEIFVFYTNNVSARLGLTKRVIITDGGDCINFEWKFNEGITFPKPTN